MKQLIALVLICAMVFSMAACSSANVYSEDNYSDEEIYDEVPEGSDLFLEGTDFVRDTEDENEWNTDGNTSDNYSNGSFATIQGEWVYYCMRGYGGIQNRWGLIKARGVFLDSEECVYSAGFELSRVSVVGDSIYFLECDKLYSIRTDGSNLKPFFDNEQNKESDYLIVDNYLYTTIIEERSSTVRERYLVRYKLESPDDPEYISSIENEIMLGFTNQYFITKKESMIYIYDRDLNRKTQIDLEKEDPTWEEADFRFLNDSSDDIMYVFLGQRGVFDQTLSKLVTIDLNSMERNTTEFGVEFSANRSSLNTYKKDGFYIGCITGSESDYHSTKLGDIGAYSSERFEEGKYHLVVKDPAKRICSVGDWLYYETNNSDFCRYCELFEKWEMLFDVSDYIG